jgi:hypothetical protein
MMIQNQLKYHFNNRTPTIKQLIKTYANNFAQS